MKSLNSTVSTYLFMLLILVHTTLCAVIITVNFSGF